MRFAVEVAALTATETVTVCVTVTVTAAGHVFGVTGATAAPKMSVCAPARLRFSARV